MAGRLCTICSGEKLRTAAADGIAQGLSDGEIAKRIGLKPGNSGNQGRMAVWRHRKGCVEGPARAVFEAAHRGRDVAEQRKEIVAAAENGDAVAQFIGLNQIAADLRRVQERLERTADAAEFDNQRLAVASLSGRQLRAGRGTREIRGRRRICAA